MAADRQRAAGDTRALRALRALARGDARGGAAALPALFGEAQARTLTGAGRRSWPACFAATCCSARAAGSCSTRRLAQIESGSPASARFARENSPLYIESIYDGHFTLAQIGKKLLAAYDKLGGAGAFGTALTQARSRRARAHVLRRQRPPASARRACASAADAREPPGASKIAPSGRHPTPHSELQRGASMAERNRRLVLAERPTGMVDERTVRMEEADAPEPGRRRGAGARALPVDRPDDPHVDGRRARLPAADRDRRSRAQRRHRRGRAQQLRAVQARRPAVRLQRLAGLRARQRRPTAIRRCPTASRRRSR